MMEGFRPGCVSGGRGGDADVRKREAGSHMASCCISWGCCEREDRAFKVQLLTYVFCGLIFFGMQSCTALYCIVLYMVCSFGGGVDGKRDLQPCSGIVGCGVSGILFLYAKQGK